MAQTWTVEALPGDYDNTEDGRALFGTPVSEEVARISELHDEGSGIAHRPLCEICSSFNLTRSDFLPQVARNNTRPQLALGSFTEISLRECALCQLVNRALQKAPRVLRSIQEHNGSVEIYLEWTTDGGWVEYRDRPDLPALGIKVNLADDERQCEHKIQLFSEPRWPELFLGRLYPTRKVNLDVIKTWLKCCEDNHQEDCKTSFRSNIPHPATKITFYAIDVKGMNLSQLKEDSVYCTLSYVWGLTKQFLTTKSSLAELSQPGGLANFWDEIPSTIQDAIGLVRDLGLQYLWVDAICIVQDDNETKMDAIKQMHLVYGKSYFTIVAGTGDNANHGLPGYRHNTRGHPQAAAIIEKGKFTIGLIPKYQAMFYKAPYNQRAWTYQELCFAPRSLVFLDGQVFYQCQQAVWREDYVAEHNNVRYQFQELHGRINHMGNRPWEGLMSSILQQYKLIFDEYTRREMTHQSDALNAYMGLSEFWSANIPFLKGSYCGFHAFLIDWLILWQSSPTAKRRSGFPSWSWVGWTGEARLPSLIPTPYKEWAFEHDCAQFNYIGNMCAFDSGPEETVAKFFPDVLKCYSTTASYTLCLPVTGQNFSNPLCPLIDRRKALCGLVQIHEWDYFVPLFDQDPEAKLVILSDMLPSQGQFLSDGEFQYDHETNPEGLIPHPTSPCTGHEGEKWEANGAELNFYNVMLVVKKDFFRVLDPETGAKTIMWVYEKAGRGVIRNTALKWALNPGPQQETMWLI